MLVQAITVFSCYWIPGSPLVEFFSFLDNLGECVRSAAGDKVVVCGDFNAWNVEWGSRATTRRGTLLSNFGWSLRLVLVNVGLSPTFTRDEASSCIDVTFSKSVIISEWRVLEEDLLSDHQYLAF